MTWSGWRHRGWKMHWPFLILSLCRAGVLCAHVASRWTVIYYCASHSCIEPDALSHQLVPCSPSADPRVYSRGETRKGARVTRTRHCNMANMNLVVAVYAQSNYPDYPGHRKENVSSKPESGGGGRQQLGGQRATSTTTVGGSARQQFQEEQDNRGGSHGGTVD